MKFQSCVAVALVSSVLVGCATAGSPGGLSNPLSSTAQTDWTPKVNMTGVNQAKYATDLTACREYASGTSSADKNKSMTKNGIKGGLLGAGAIGVLAVATGGLAILPMVAGAAVTAGAAGAASGAVTGNLSANTAYKEAVNGCLSGRGYKVES